MTPEEQREFDLSCKVQRESIKAELVKAEEQRTTKIIQLRALTEWHKARDGYENDVRRGVTPEQKQQEIEAHKLRMLEFAKNHRKNIGKGVKIG